MFNEKVNLNPKIGQEDIEQVPTRNGYGEGVVELGEENENVMVLTADLAGSTKVSDFQKKYPERFLEMGIAEQNMMGVAAGLSWEGKIPFVSSYAVFSPGRNWDQLRVSVAYSKANVKVAGAHAGISVGPDGATHQALEDIAITRVLPNMTVVVPCDYLETKKATIALGRMEGPVYFRFARGKPLYSRPNIHHSRLVRLKFLKKVQMLPLLVLGRYCITACLQRWSSRKKVLAAWS
jgi:transketolase